MFKLIILFAVSLAACHATPAVYCGVFPPSLFKCLNNPGIFGSEVYSRCASSKSECEKSSCLFREANLVDGTAVNKVKVSSYLNQYAKEHPEWAPAVEHAQTSCLGDNLPAQGWYIDCPAYDIIHCILTNFIKVATPSQWPSTKECEYPRLYAGACPVCPEDCFNPQVPIGSCNACKVTPTTRTN